MDFLYSATGSTSRRRERAASRSSSASPDLWRVRARTPDQMRLANAFCRFVEIAGAAADPRRRPTTTAPPLEVLTLGLD